VTEQQVIEMHGRMRGDLSFNVPMFDEDGNLSGEWQDLLVYEEGGGGRLLEPGEQISDPLLAKEKLGALGDALSVLNDRERRIFEARQLTEEPLTLKKLAAELGMSCERVRQIEARAFEKVQQAVKNRIVAED
jgi:RNA polymerase sigma-32 factor